MAYLVSALSLPNLAPYCLSYQASLELCRVTFPVWAEVQCYRGLGAEGGGDGPSMPWLTS